MTEKEIFEKFYSIFCETFSRGQIGQYIKAGSRSIFIFTKSGEQLFFVWNGEHDWALSCVLE